MSKKTTETTTTSNGLETANGITKKIYNGVRKKAIKFGEPKVNETDELIEKKWESNPFGTNNSIVKFGYSFNKTPHHIKGKRRNPKYVIELTSNNVSEEFSGLFARKIYNTLTRTGASKKRTSEITPETIKFANSALDGL
jgi:hypothetical protein